MRSVIFSIMLMTVSLLGQTVRVTYVIGDVQWKAAPSDEQWAPLSMNSQLKNGNMVRTGPESICELQFPDGSVSKIMANSQMEIRQIPTLQNENGALFTNLGRFFFNITKKLAGKLRISSPVSVAAIRGTQLLLINQPDTTNLWVKEGVVEFGDPDLAYHVLVKALQKSHIGLNGIPSAPLALTPQEIQELNAMSQLHTPTTGRQEKPKLKKQKIEETPQPEPVPEHKPSEIQPQAPRQEKTPAESQPKAQERGHGINTGLALGAVTIDGQLYNQIGLRPEFSIGKLGVALDLSFYIDQNGNIRKENWNSFKDIFEKIYYIRWAQRGDPFYFRVGAINNYRLGFGILMNHYANTVEYPSVIRTGLELGFNTQKYRFDAMINNFSEVFSGGGLFAGRLGYRPFGKLEIGFSTVFDANQYKALKDRDGDGVPDLLDDFPDNKHLILDSDGDGIPDEQDFDRDGDGFTDNKELLIKTFGPAGAALYNEQDSVLLKPEPFNINKAKDKSQLALALDASYPLISYKYLQLTTYAQYAKYPFNGSWGITAPGFWAKFAFVHAYAEYRIFGRGFLPEYFNTTYELERATYREEGDSVKTLQPYTKRQYLQDHLKNNMQGFVVGANFNVFDFMIFGAEYQNMSKNAVHFRTFRANLDLNTRFIPKINRAGAYYYQNNAMHLFRKSEGTILGYRIEYEISPSASLLLDFRQTYRDLNGDGKISGPKETVKTTNIQTVIRF